MIRLLLTWITGFKGMPIPYSPKLDDGITILLLCCFFISAYVLSRSRKFLVQLMKDFLLNRDYTDQQRFGIRLSYQFNATKSKYKGTGAGASEKSRL